MVSLVGDDMPKGSVAAWLRQRRGYVLRQWEDAARADMAAARQLSAPDLLDRFPVLIERVVEMIEALEAGKEPPVPHEDADRHARHRLEKGYELSDMVREYALLRECILRLAAHDEQPRTLEHIHAALDRAVAISVQRYTEARHRTLEALDRIASATLEAPNLDSLLMLLLQVFVDTTPAVDVSVIFLSVNSQLQLRAAIGLGDEVGREAFRAMGEGFTGTIALRREPLEATDTFNESLIESEALRKSGVRSLYGVPMLVGAELVGVAYMGSRVSHGLSSEDKSVFGVLAVRASYAIQLHRLREEESATSERLREALEFRERLIAMLGHDLRTPLSSIQMGAQLLLRNVKMPPVYFPPLARIAGSAERMERMIRDILDFARSRQSGGITIQRTDTRLQDVCESVIEELQITHPDRVLDLQRLGNCDGFWDPDRLAQVAGNLLSNALKYGSPVHPITIRVGGDAENGFLEVHNWGNPILAEEIPHLFEPFRRGRPMAKEGGRGGLGVGLYIVRETVSAHGGRIEVTSNRKEGTLFRVVIPKQMAGSIGS